MIIDLVFERGPCDGLRTSVDVEALPLRIGARCAEGNVEVTWASHGLNGTHNRDGAWTIYRTLAAFRKPGEPVVCLFA